jgi:hypothetical protein
LLLTSSITFYAVCFLCVVILPSILSNLAHTVFRNYPDPGANRTRIQIPNTFSKVTGTVYCILKKFQVISILGASIFLISLHAAFYNFDALDIPEEKVTFQQLFFVLIIALKGHSYENVCVRLLL